MREEGVLERPWSGKTGGTDGMQDLLIEVLRFMPQEMIYCLVALVVPFYMVFYHKAYLAIYRYFRYRIGYGRVKSFFNVYRNFFIFGQVVIDRFAAFAGRQYRVKVENLELFNELASAEGGFLMLSSHVGCYEIAGCMLTSWQKKFNAIVYAGETETILKNREKRMSGHNMKMIPLKKDLSHLILINAALNSGEIVSLSADRVNGSCKTVKCSFFDSEANFPQGPFSLARMKGIPMLAVFVMKEGVRRYHIYLSKVEDAKQFSAHLETVLRKYPAQWFNYYDFWGQV